MPQQGNITFSRLEFSIYKLHYQFEAQTTCMLVETTPTE